jgi:hypothetical protein
MSIGQAAFVAASANSDAGPGLLGFLVVVALGLALIVLYRSLRRQLGRIDFDAQGTTDAERMRPPGSSDDDTAA